MTWRGQWRGRVPTNFHKLKDNYRAVFETYCRIEVFELQNGNKVKGCHLTTAVMMLRSRGALPMPAYRKEQTERLLALGFNVESIEKKEGLRERIYYVVY